MKMNCELCLEAVVGPDHDISPKHIKNQVLYEFSVSKRKLTGNRKGVIVSCTVSSAFRSIVDYTDPRIVISVKPNEEVVFKFSILNDTKREYIDVVLAQIVHSKLDFNADGIKDFIDEPVTLTPKMKLKKDIHVNFKSADIGMYEVPIRFAFYKKETKESIVIIRDMVVFVEERQTKHKTILSPYTNQEIKADKLIPSTHIEKSDDIFRVPPNLKPVYSRGLKSEGETEDFKNLLEDVTNTFECGATEANYIRYFHNLLWYEETIVRINLKKYNMSNVRLSQCGQAFALYVPGLAEKRPSLMPGDKIFIKPHDSDIVMFEGTMCRVEENYTIIQHLDPKFQSYYSRDATFDVRFLMSRLTFERMHIAVDNVFMQGQTSRIFPSANPQPPAVKPIERFYNHLIEDNPEQKTAVEHVVSRTSGLAPYLVHGPPGTGKTVTIVECILQLISKSPDNRILVCTDSNMAADHVASVIIKYLHLLDDDDKMLLRASSRFRVWESLPECLYDYSNGSCLKTFRPVSIALFMQYRIVVTTLSHAAKFANELHQKRYDRHITHIFIDEAAQASEPSCLIPITGLLTKEGAVVLSGDPLQLGPVIISRHAKKLGLGLSLMERLKNTVPLYNDENHGCNYTVMLKNNFRSNADILQIPNEIFYNSQLKALAADDSLSNVDILGTKPTSRAICFHGVLSKEQRMGKSPSFYNVMELELVQKYIIALVTQHRVDLEDIGVITPYMRQMHKIKKWLTKQEYSRIEVGTVEAFQGKEKRVIIISTVRANHQLLAHDAKFQLGFLVDDKRFNVALTRAKAKVIIIGNPVCLQKDIKWRTYLQRCRDLGTYHGFDFVEDDEETNVIKKLSSMVIDFKKATVS